MKAAAFSYSSTAMPRLSGALITVAGFMPIGFAHSTTAKYAGGIFWIVGIAVVFSWLCSGMIVPYLAVKMLPKDLGQHHHGADPYGRQGHVPPFTQQRRSPPGASGRHRTWVLRP